MFPSGECGHEHDAVSYTHLDVYKRQIVSAVMPLVPGVTFTTAIRDTLNGDYAAGSARILEAIVVGLAVAFGVGAGLLVARSMEGGPL